LVVILGKNVTQVQKQLESFQIIFNESEEYKNLKEIEVETNLFVWNGESVGEILEKL